MLNHKSSNLNLENISLAERKSSGSSSTHYRKKTTISTKFGHGFCSCTLGTQNKIKCFCLFQDSPNTSLLVFVAHLIWGDFLCQMTQLRRQFFSLGARLDAWIGGLICLYGGWSWCTYNKATTWWRTESIHTIHVFIYIFGWFFMVNVGKF